VMLVTEQARVESWQLGLSLKGRRRRPNSRIVRGSCPAQVGSKNAAGRGFQSRHDFNGSETGRRFRVEPDLLGFGPQQGRPYFTYLPGGG
jgi:hypothetical protein